MLSAIVELGRAHELVVVAEGIDTEAKLAAVAGGGLPLRAGLLVLTTGPVRGDVVVPRARAGRQSRRRPDLT